MGQSGSWRICEVLRAQSNAELRAQGDYCPDDATEAALRCVHTVPALVHSSSYEYKYRLLHGRAGEWLVGYESECPKGDNGHVLGCL